MKKYRVLMVCDDLAYCKTGYQVSEAIKDATAFCCVGFGGDEIANASIGDELEMGHVIADVSADYDWVDLSSESVRRNLAVWTRGDYWEAVK